MTLKLPNWGEFNDASAKLQADYVARWQAADDAGRTAVNKWYVAEMRKLEARSYPHAVSDDVARRFSELLARYGLNPDADGWRMLAIRLACDHLDEFRLPKPPKGLPPAKDRFFHQDSAIEALTTPPPGRAMSEISERDAARRVAESVGLSQSKARGRADKTKAAAIDDEAEAIRQRRLRYRRSGKESAKPSERVTEFLLTGDAKGVPQVIVELMTRSEQFAILDSITATMRPAGNSPESDSE